MMDKLEYKKALIEVGKHVLNGLVQREPRGYGFNPSDLSAWAYAIADEFLQKVENNYPTP